MAAITPADWGRIYAYIWLDFRKGGGYKTKFEQDPSLAVKEIAAKLGINYYDSLFNLDIPLEDYTDQQLDTIIRGEAPQCSVIMRLCS